MTSAINWYGMHENEQPAFSLMEAAHHGITVAIVRRADGVVQTEYSNASRRAVVTIAGTRSSRTRHWRLETPEGVVLRHGLSHTHAARETVRRYILFGVTQP